ncbi:hypothetical protein [Tenacibaculum jejuense]|uniref:Uncharacterized protein n=1 Tax=Tenacibaculum jejuense TaxID=584609 RepID=A0A238UCH2_9FLAO|nr:hypothetical protein [Tenacibaculum jejuense]SNR16917.1 protein of unknown function [Tenacibaculum jejuense]
MIILCILSCKSTYYANGNPALKTTASKTEQEIKKIKKIASSEQKKDKDASGGLSVLKTIDKLEDKQKELFYLLDGCNERSALTTEYLNSLEESYKALQKVAKEKEIVKRQKTLEAIYLDYKAKEIAINSSENNDANTKVKVIVDSSEDQGFFVFGKLSFEGNLNIKRFRFTKPTQQASQDFVPGYYLFWLEKGDLIGKPELHLITISGEEKEKILVLKTPKK